MLWTINHQELSFFCLWSLSHFGLHFGRLFPKRAPESKFFKKYILIWNQFRRKKKTSQWLDETGAFSPKEWRGDGIVLSPRERSVMSIVRNQYPHTEDGVGEQFSNIKILNTHTFEKLIPFLGISLTRKPILTAALQEQNTSHLIVYRRKEWAATVLKTPLLTCCTGKLPLLHTFLHIFCMPFPQEML